jgi:hypothetical protein
MWTRNSSDAAGFPDISTIHRAYYYHYSLFIDNQQQQQGKNKCESEQNEMT